MEEELYEVSYMHSALAKELFRKKMIIKNAVTPKKSYAEILENSKPKEANLKK